MHLEMNVNWMHVITGREISQIREDAPVRAAKIKISSKESRTSPSTTVTKHPQSWIGIQVPAERGAGGQMPRDPYFHLVGLYGITTTWKD